MEVSTVGSRGSGSGGKRTRIIAIANQKGGVGKSTTAVSLGAALAELGFRVLVVDLDPQGNASTGLGIRHEARRVTVYEVLADEAPVQRAIVSTLVPGLDAIPSTIDLAGAEIELVSQFSRELRLRRALEPLRDGTSYDFVFLDCPPSLGLLTINALAAAEELIVPIQCEYYALEGLGQLLRNVRLVQQNVNPRLKLTGIVMTMFDPRTKLSEQVVAEVQRFFGDRVYGVVIPRTVRLSEAPGFGQPITVYDPRSKGAESYRALAREVAGRPPPPEPVPLIEELPRVILTPPDGPEDGPASGGDAPPVEGPPLQAPGEHAAAPLPDDQLSGSPPPSSEAEVEVDISNQEGTDGRRAGGEGVAADEASVATASGAEGERPGTADGASAGPGQASTGEGTDAPGRRGAGPVPTEGAPRPAPTEPPRPTPTEPPRPGSAVVVIDEDTVLPGEGQGDVVGVAAEPGASLAEVGETLPREAPRRRRWRLFRRGRDG